MKRSILYLHGFASSGASGTVEILRKAFLCHGLFGDEDAIGLPWRDEFERHYPGMSRIFHGGHRMNADVVHHVLIPFIHELKVFEGQK